MSNLKKTRKALRAPGRILIVQLADLGDLIMAAPAIHSLRTKFPRGELTLLTKPGNIQAASQIADHVIVVDKHLLDGPTGLLKPRTLTILLKLIFCLRRQHFDRVILLHHLTTRFGALKWAALCIAVNARIRQGLDNGRGWFLNSRLKDRGFGAANEEQYWQSLVKGSMPIQVGAEESAYEGLLKAKGVSEKYIVLHPGSGAFSTARRWPREYFTSLAQNLVTELGVDIVVVGGAEESSLADSILAPLTSRAVNLCGYTNLSELSGILQKARMFIGNDTGVAQVAAQLNIPRIVIFGPTSPATWHVPGSLARPLRLDIACSPCLYQDFQLGTPSGCSTRECLWLLSPQRVLREAVDLMREHDAL